MAKRRSPRVVWLPPDRFNRIGLDPNTGSVDPRDSSGFTFNLTVPAGASAAASGRVSAAIPIVGDNPQNPSVTGPAFASLSDLENSSYRLRRIVGKLWIAAIPSGLPDINNLALFVTAGIIVLRVDQLDGTDPLAGAASLTYDPATFGSAADPWVWRRSWVLGNADATASAWPKANWQYGSAFDGAHIDQKTARIVAAEERLFLVISIQNVVPDGNQNDNWSVDVIGETRVLASMRTSIGNRRNASR